MYIFILTIKLKIAFTVIIYKIHSIMTKVKRYFS